MIDPPSLLDPPFSGATMGVDPGWTDSRVRTWLRLFMAIGVVLRLLRFALDHPLWRDEAFLAANLLGRDFKDLTRPLDYGQVCPLFFLWAEKGMSLVFGFNEWSLRLIPTVASLASLSLFRHLAGRLLQGEALVMAVAILAIGYTPIRHGGEIKPYSTDFFVALILITLAVEWLRAPGRVRFLWGLAAVGPLALGLSNPAIFVEGALGLVLAIPILQMRSLRAIVPFMVFAVGTVATFLVLLRWINGPQSQNVMAWMQVYWVNAFPPRSLAPLLGWLVRVHTSHMLAYPAGGDRGSSALTTILVVAAVVAWFKRRSKTVLAVLLTPFALGMVAAALGRYPYGGSARTMQYVAPAIILLAGLGASVLLARLPRPSSRERAPRVILSTLFAVGLGMVVWDLAAPYKALEDQTARNFARQFWAEESSGAEILCARTDLKLKLNPLVWEGERAAFYLCYQAIDRDQHPDRASTRLDRVSEAHPLRVIVFGEVPGDSSTVDRWMVENKDRYKLRSRRERVLNPGLMQGKAPAEDRYVIYELIPAQPARQSEPGLSNSDDLESR